MPGRNIYDPYYHVYVKENIRGQNNTFCASYDTDIKKYVILKKISRGGRRMSTEKDTYIAGNLEEETELLQKEAVPADITLQTVLLTIFCC